MAHRRASTRKASRKTHRKASRKTHRKASRKTHRKAYRKASRKTHRKASRMMTRRFFGGFAPFESFQDPTMQATSFGQNITGAEQQVKIKTQAARPSNIRSGMKQASNRS